MMNFKNLAVALGLGLSTVAGSAWADPSINGTASVTGFFDTYSASANAVVNNLNFIDVTAAASLGATTGNFMPNGVATATDFSINPVVVGMIYSFNGFTFTVQSITNILRDALTCNGTGCVDGLAFTIGGVVSKVGFADTLFTGGWTGNGSCTQAGTSGNCNQPSKSGSWSVSLAAIGQPIRIPEPGTLALLGLGLAGLGFARRRKV